MTYRRNRLSVKTLEALELLKSWMHLDNWEDYNVSEDIDEAPGNGINEWTAPSGRIYYLG
jgi:hypothetical protein